MPVSATPGLYVGYLLGVVIRLAGVIVLITDFIRAGLLLTEKLTFLPIRFGKEMEIGQTRKVGEIIPYSKFTKVVTMNKDTNRTFKTTQ